MASFLDMQIPPRRYTLNINQEQVVPTAYGTPILMYPGNLTQDNPPSYLRMDTPSVVPASPMPAPAPAVASANSMPAPVTEDDALAYTSFLARERYRQELEAIRQRRRNGEWMGHVAEPWEGTPDDYRGYDPFFDEREQWLEQRLNDPWNSVYMGQYAPYFVR